MKKVLFVAVFLGINTFAHAQEIKCGDIKFNVPAKVGDFPSIDFVYQSKVAAFSFRDGNLLLIANDEREANRTRIVISAQFNKAKRVYLGQIVRDDGGHELQLDNGPVSCTAR